MDIRILFLKLFSMTLVVGFVQNADDFHDYKIDEWWMNRLNAGRWELTQQIQNREK